MKATGIIRRIDKMGRIVLPAGLRRTMGISDRETLEIFTDGSAIILKKYVPACIFCDSGHKVSRFKGKMVCAKCLRQLRGSPADAEGEETPPEPE